MKITNNTLVECKKCKNKIEIDKEDFEYETSSHERSKGLETQHYFSGVYSCDKCKNEIDIEIVGVEYPKGVKTYENVQVDGGKFITKPKVSI